MPWVACAERRTRTCYRPLFFCGLEWWWFCRIGALGSCAWTREIRVGHCTAPCWLATGHPTVVALKGRNTNTNWSSHISEPAHGHSLSSILPSDSFCLDHIESPLLSVAFKIDTGQAIGFDKRGELDRQVDVTVPPAT